MHALEATTDNTKYFNAGLAILLWPVDREVQNGLSMFPYRVAMLLLDFSYVSDRLPR